MSVTNSTEFALKRARIELEKAHNRQDWVALRHWDKKLGDFLNQAFDDENRNTRALITELEVILSTYNRVVSNLSDSAPDCHFVPDN